MIPPHFTILRLWCCIVFWPEHSEMYLSDHFAKPVKICFIPLHGSSRSYLSTLSRASRLSRPPCSLNLQLKEKFPHKLTCLDCNTRIVVHHARNFFPFCLHCWRISFPTFESNEGVCC